MARTRILWRTLAALALTAALLAASAAPALAWDLYNRGGW